MDRRQFLRTAGLLAGTLGSGSSILSACGEASAVPAGEATWSLVPGGYPELLAGSGRRFAFGLVTRDNVRVEDTGVTVFTRAVGGEVQAGPFEARYHADAGGGLGIYVTAVDVPTPGVVEIVAVSGEDHGDAAVNVVEPADSAVPAPGLQAIVTPTPTPGEPLSYGTLCTRTPPCPMHAESLDDVLAASRPALLLFATPAYCQTAVCAPGVDTLLEVRDSRDWGALAFIHCEIFTDEGVTVGEPVRQWGLPSEPWLFAIDGEGTISTRLDGPMIAEEITALAQRVS